MRILIACALLAGCAAPLNAPVGVTIPLSWAGLPGWKVRVLTSGLRITTPLLTLRPAADGVIGCNVIREF